MKIISKLVGMGFDISTKKALKKALQVIGIKPNNLERLYIDIKNSTHKDAFKRIPPKDKIVFLPQCLRDSKKCKATLDETGYHCQECGACKIADIKKKAEKLGYTVYIAPGGTMVYNLVEKEKPKAALGVACLKELCMAVENLNIPTQAVELLKDGCIDTDVSLEEVFSALEGNGVSEKS